ncbi:zinc ribbon domain-containing protein [Kibdelosporangium aridum]|uniref:zinc ribbon domain-containing protein n=1 Tax=Kibdelosporangium aridum TaxID=2030 RepID=UPI0037C01436
MTRKVHSTCGCRLTDLPLSVRHWTCPACRTRHDRDANAAKNILAAGRAVARGRTLGDACGADVRRQGASLPRSAVNQETSLVKAGPSSAEGKSMSVGIRLRIGRYTELGRTSKNYIQEICSVPFQAWLATDANSPAGTPCWKPPSRWSAKGA